MLIAQRSKHMPEPLQWEFPGGKLEPNEQEQECLIREMQEELALAILPVTRLEPVVYTYPTKTILLIPYICRYVGGNVKLAEHQEYAWVLPQDLPSYDWCPADVPVVAQYLQLKQTAS